METSKIKEIQFLLLLRSPVGYLFIKNKIFLHGPYIQRGTLYKNVIEEIVRFRNEKGRNKPKSISGWRFYCIKEAPFCTKYRSSKLNMKTPFGSGLKDNRNYYTIGVLKKGNRLNYFPTNVEEVFRWVKKSKR